MPGEHLNTSKHKTASNVADTHLQAQLDQALALHKQGQLQQAHSIYLNILDIQANHANALNLLGVIAIQTNNHERAVELIDRAIAIDPDIAKYYGNRGNALKELKQLEAALASCDKAIAINPDYVEAYSNRGLVLQERRQLDAAVASYDKAIAINPDYAEAHFNKSLALLLSGNLKEGWKLYQWRWRSESLATPKRNFAQPLWLGNEPLNGRTLLLHSEQGLGDTIQFCRYAKLAAELGARVILEVPKPLVGLLTGLEGVAELVESGKPIPAFDLHCPLLSLPLAFDNDLTTLPLAQAYLHSDAIKTAAWASALGAKKKPRVGLVWSGSIGHKNDRNRSIPLSRILPYLPASCDYISLQKELRDADRATLGSQSSVEYYGDKLTDFTDTAALCELMDVVISVDTSVAHLAAALGKQTWIMLPSVPDWRWLLDRMDSVWYPSVRLYRQPDSRDWTFVLDRIRADLNKLASGF